MIDDMDINAGEVVEGGSLEDKGQEIRVPLAQLGAQARVARHRPLANTPLGSSRTGVLPVDVQHSSVCRMSTATLTIPNQAAAQTPPGTQDADPKQGRDPIGLHWPVIELAPVPGRPILPVIRARLMIACAVRTP